MKLDNTAETGGRPHAEREDYFAAIVVLTLRVRTILDTTA
jgi:hypothetical protein